MAFIVIMKIIIFLIKFFEIYQNAKIYYSYFAHLKNFYTFLMNFKIPLKFLLEIYKL